jgi:hypothetical protein
MRVPAEVGYIGPGLGVGLGVGAGVGVGVGVGVGLGIGVGACRGTWHVRKSSSPRGGGAEPTGGVPG